MYFNSMHACVHIHVYMYIYIYSYIHVYVIYIYIQLHVRVIYINVFIIPIKKTRSRICRRAACAPQYVWHPRPSEPRLLRRDRCPRGHINARILRSGSQAHVIWYGVYGIVQLC